MAAIDDKINEWKELSKSGKFDEAHEFYYNELFPHVIDKFRNTYARTVDRTETLFSIIGFTPEPIILTQHALQPKNLVIFYTNKDEDANVKIMEVIDRFKSVNYHLVELSDESFATIYDTLNEQMKLYPSRSYALDITGGKKSMVASATIFGRDYSFDILYVDFAQYDPDLRRPIPGSEILNVVYSPKKDLPELFHADVSKEAFKIVGNDFDVKQFTSGKRWEKISDVTQWDFFNFDSAKEVIKKGNDFIAIWDKSRQKSEK